MPEKKAMSARKPGELRGYPGGVIANVARESGVTGPVASRMLDEQAARRQPRSPRRQHRVGRGSTTGDHDQSERAHEVEGYPVG